MGLKKYEIITVGSDKRVRALRPWAVGDRYVNIGDVGGIVYDEKTLSQDGACWLFRGNFGFPGARIGGDSIVDVGEATLSTTGTPAVDILGSSVVVGGKLQFASEQTAADFVVLKAADFEQGNLNDAVGVNWEDLKASSPVYIRTKSPIFAGGTSVTLKCDVPGYLLKWFALDRDGVTTTVSATVTTGEGVTTKVPPCQYFLVRLTKNPAAATVPADATSAKITFTGTYETKLSIIDSRVEINPATSTGISSIRPGGSYTIASGAKYPEAIIRNSKVSANVPASTGRTFRIMGQIIGSTATLDGTTGSVILAGIYSNVKNLTASGLLTTSTGVDHYNVIQATDCNNFAVSPTIFPGLAAGETANMPFVFQGCNVPNGVFYHHAQIKNTYVNIDFALAQADLGKAITSGQILASAEVEGMYRLYSTTGSVFGALVESYDSVKSLNMEDLAKSYGTTIYKDAYFNGPFDFAGTNVFGNKVRSHPLAQVLNVQPRAVQGGVPTDPGTIVTGADGVSNRVSVLVPFRINSSHGLSVDNVPAGIDARAVYVTPANVVVTSTGWANPSWKPDTPALVYYAAYVMFRKTGDAAITPEDLAGVTVTVYNGCKIVNTGETAVNMKGNIRVEGNATLTNASITGTGYFGGNCVMSGMIVNGYAYMKDNTLCTKTSENVQTFASLVMEGNAVYNSVATSTLTGLKVFMYDNSKILGTVRSQVTVVMRDNATITAAGSFSGSSTGSITIKDNAILGGTLFISGDITLCGSYNQTVNKTWTGKRTITDVNEPEYSNNCRTQYDF